MNETKENYKLSNMKKEQARRRQLERKLECQL